MLNNLQTLRQAITLAQLDSVNTVTIDMSDLVMLERKLREYEQLITDLQINNLLSEGLSMTKAPKIDIYS